MSIECCGRESTEMNKTNIEMQKLNHIAHTHTQTLNHIQNQITEHFSAYFLFNAHKHTYAVIGAIFGRRNAQNPFKYFLDTQNERENKKQTTIFQFMSVLFFFAVTVFVFVFFPR